ncbi:host attachment protein [Thiomicrorhabdus sp.]|uniref:host attachment protein n=1 Tax=Thiomicrorhabdus sp. TaxID=2039724 RepID=UPI00356A5030
MKPVWILVADSSRARIFTAENSVAELIEIETLAHPEGRLHEQEMDSDLPGKANGVQGAGGHVYTDEVSPKEQEEVNFAKSVSSHLCDELNQNKFEKLFVVAAPAFLGELRQSFSTRLTKHVAFTLDKNVVSLSPQEIRTYLPHSFA